MKLDWLHLALLVLLGVLGVAFWMDLYRYERVDSSIARIHRLTGDVEILTRTGWRLLDEPLSPRISEAEEARAAGDRLLKELGRDEKGRPVAKAKQP